MHRDSAALDLIEALRPRVDAYLLDLLRTQMFAKRDFVELPNGQVRIAPRLAKALATSTLTRWEQGAAPVAEHVARILADSATSPVRVRTRLTQADRKRGRRGEKSRSASSLASACRICGLVLQGGRKVCDECLPAYDRLRTEKLASAGKATLAAMRASTENPALSPGARAKLVATSKERMLAIRAWERKHGKVVDRARYEAEVLPVIEGMTVPALVAVTQLSTYYLWQVRSGRKRLHPMHWDNLLRATGRMPGELKVRFPHSETKP